MLKKENKFIPLLSSIIIIAIIIIGKYLGAMSYIYLLAVPLYLSVVFYITKVSERREKIDLAVAYCLEESDFNVIDKIEQLRVYFSNTSDLIEYLSVVDSKVLTFVFDERNSDLSYKDYITGAVRCLNSFKSFSGNTFFNIDIISIQSDERLGTILSTLYLVSKHIDKGSKSIYINSTQRSEILLLDVTDQNKNRSEEDQFFEKLLNIFSSNEYVLKAQCS